MKKILKMLFITLLLFDMRVSETYTEKVTTLSIQFLF